MDAFEIITLKDFLKGAEVEIKCTLSLELLLDYISMPDNETFLSNCQISHDDCVKLKNYAQELNGQRIKRVLAFLQGAGYAVESSELVELVKSGFTLEMISRAVTSKEKDALVLSGLFETKAQQLLNRVHYHDDKVVGSHKTFWIIANLDRENINCDRLFNLVSLYGNVEKIRIDGGYAAVQMNCPKPLVSMVSLIHKTEIFGKKIKIYKAQQDVMELVLQPGEKETTPKSYGSVFWNQFIGKPTKVGQDKPDEPPLVLYKEYSDRDNGYTRVEAATLPPTNVLKWAGTPPGFDEGQLKNLLRKCGAKSPNKVEPSDGLAEWSSISDSVETVMLANNTEISNESRTYKLKLSFC